MIRIQRKLGLTFGALGACFTVVVGVAALTTRHLSATLDELLRVATVQSDLRALDDALDHARAEADGYLLSGDRAHLRRSMREVAAAESTFSRLLAPAEAERAQFRSLTQLRTEMTLLERVLDSELVFERGRGPPNLQHSDHSRDTAANLTIDVIARMERTEHDRLLATAGMLRTADVSLSIAVLALCAVGVGIALTSYASMRADLARRTRAGEAIRESEAKFAGILAIAGDAIVTADEHGCIVDFNRSAEEMFGYRAEDVRGKPLHLLLPERLRDARAAATGVSEAAGADLDDRHTRLELPARRFDGTSFYVEAAVSRLPTRAGFLVTIVLRDITDERRRERREHLLAEAATRLSPRLPYEEQLSVIAHLGVPAIADWSILDVVEESDDGKTRLHRVTSMPRDQALEGALWELEAHAPHWAAHDPVLDVIRTGTAVFAEPVTEEWIEARYTDDSVRDILRRIHVDSLIIVPLRSDGRVTGVLTLGTVAPRRAGAQERELAELLAERAAPAIEAARLYRKSQRSTAARDAFLGIVSHDLNGALGTIAMFTKAIGESREDAPRHERLCANVLEATAIMRRLMLDLVDISAIEAHRLSVSPETDALAPILESLREMFAARAEASGITLTVAAADDLPLVRIDATRVLQVLTNLVDNSIKFTPAGGSVTVDAKADAREVLVSVRDTGAGVAPDELPHIFERFWRARSSRGTRGFGLGLAIVHGIVVAHGGRAWMESTLGRGSTVWFTLPRASIAPAPALPGATRPDAETAGA
ncbi:MAG TPA: PAS domain-containing sensor histidine kinase [Gemmatimonadaceae bacterium]|nr:PAS domain-containing sensor histidine kinase [Gemmatimonadaceae bacterium]